MYIHVLMKITFSSRCIQLTLFAKIYSLRKHRYRKLQFSMVKYFLMFLGALVQFTLMF